jgi:multiple sugar transport system ATP-binding protein
MLQIEHLLDRRPAQLSGGQRQRVAMGRALARDPQLFLFDEPLSNLDAKLRVEMRAEIKRMHHVSGITSVYVTHDQIEAMTLGSRIAVMKDGILQQIGTPDEIYRTPANTYVAGFIGSPTMNFIEGRTENPGPNAKFVFTGGALDLPTPAGPEYTLGQRPEHIHLSDDAPWRGEVVLVEPTGADTYVVVKTGMGLITVRAPANTKLKIGETVGMTVSGRHNNWFDKKTGLRMTL